MMRVRDSHWNGRTGTCRGVCSRCRSYGIALDYAGLGQNDAVFAGREGDENEVVQKREAGGADTASHRRFERFALTLVLGSFLVFRVLLFIHPPAGQMIQDMMVPA
jgi:hypothetical protein